jgi:hypothetical protein
MIRGTTAPFKFEVPYDTNTISAIVVTFSQKHWYGTDTAKLPIKKWYLASWATQEDGSVKLVETRNDGFAFSTTNSKEIQTNLTEEETLRFSDKEKAYMQIRVIFDLDEGQVARASLPQKITVYPVLSDEQIGTPTPSEVIDNVYIFDAGVIEAGE